MNDPAINEKGELACTKALSDLFARRDMMIVCDTVHDTYAIKHGRRIETETAKAFIAEASAQGIVKQGFNNTTLVRAWWHVNRPRRR